MKYYKFQSNEYRVRNPFASTTALKRFVMLKFNMLVRFTFVLCHPDFDAFIKIFLIFLAFFVMPQMFVSF